jgi:DNA segregation ATPase FtsK/SpoIIIE, S-DNA-T family
MATSRSTGQSKGRRREIFGIALLGLGLFSLISVISMQAGNNLLMGPGGASAAAAIYSLGGVASYLLITASLVIAVRLCRGRRIVDGVIEALGFLALLFSVAVLCHLPFADDRVLLHGPGGLLGQYLGQILATFVGGVGAALCATTLLATAILLLTDIRVSEVLDSLAWAGGHVASAALWTARAAGRAAVVAGRAIGRVVVAMFPEKSAAERAKAESDLEESEAEELEAEALDSERSLDRECRAELAEAEASGPEDDRSFEDDAPAMRSSAEIEIARPVVFAEPVSAETEVVSDVHEPIQESESRRAVAAVVAEVAAVECAALAEAADDKPAQVQTAPGLPPIAIIAPVTSPLDDGPTEANAAAPVSMPERGPSIVPPVAPAILAAEKAAPVEDGPGFIRLSDGAFQLPSSDLLEYIPPKGNETDEATLRAMAERLELALGNYGVRGKVTAIQMGPVIVTFEFAPAPGTRTGKIVQLENDLAMALEAQSVRIVAPIPGKAVVGIEIPNKKRETVYLKEILEDDSFRKSGSKLQICLGKDTKGAPVSVNLSKMPHLLVAGTTGSGKSVAVNGMITSILYSANPEEVRFIMVDPKMLELSIYEGIPHLLLPVVTDPKKASLALRWAVDEMERRYELLAKSGVRDISSYNARIEADQNRVRVDDSLEIDPRHSKRLKVVMADADGNEQEIEVDAESGPVPPSDGSITAEMAEEISDKAAAAQFAKDHAEPPARKLPYIVIVIDEFADLMMVASKEVDTAVARLAQKARAAGLHLILATQRPSVDVITGVIKANFPSRIALQVASQIDSRTIMGQPGAETLLGNGDMLFSDRGTKLRRIQGAFLSDDEVHRVVDFLKKQAKPVYDMNILTAREEEDGEGAAALDDFHDDLYDQAVAIVCDTRQASVSFIQRRLQIGYNRAARMVEQMEREGLVGPSNGIKPREVVAPRGEYLTQPGA